MFRSGTKALEIGFISIMTEDGHIAFIGRLEFNLNPITG
jgi:hypothetical protein